jgi:RNA-directed DNA polymerase
MKEPYVEGLASHHGPESCVGPLRSGREALTGADAGQVLSHEKGFTFGIADLVPNGGRQHRHRRNNRRACGRVPGVADPAHASETPHTGTGRSRQVPVAAHDGSGPAGGGQESLRPARTPREVTHQHNTDDRAEQARQHRAAEAREARTVTKGNPKGETGPDTQRSQNPVNAQQRVREAARKDRNLRFNNLMHHITPRLLMESFEALNPKAVPGIDEVTWKQYRENAVSHIRILHQRVHSGGYRAKPSRRIYIPKADGRQRPIGIAALEDKIVQQAVVTILSLIYEEDFLDLSYGSRPGRMPHQALDELYVELTEGRVEWILDADIRSFFDSLNHDWLMKFVAHRVADQRILRLIAKWLRAGVSEDGQWSETKVGTPQGAVISPLLANIYLHYVLDLWVEAWRKKHAKGKVIIVRYADDFVMGFERQEDAQRLLKDLNQRVKTFGLELHPEKTRLIEFGRHAERNRAKKNMGKPETFDFLGFTHICARRRKDGTFTVWRKTISKRLKNKVKEIRQKLKRGRHRPVKLQGKWLRQVVQGHLNYYAVPNNYHALSRFCWEVGKAWYQALCRRSQKARRLSWKKMKKLLNSWMPKPRIIHPWPDQRFRRSRTSRPKVRAV